MNVTKYSLYSGIGVPEPYRTSMNLTNATRVDLVTDGDLLCWGFASNSNTVCGCLNFTTGTEFSESQCSVRTSVNIKVAVSSWLRLACWIRTGLDIYGIGLETSIWCRSSALLLNVYSYVIPAHNSSILPSAFEQNLDIAIIETTDPVICFARSLSDGSKFGCLLLSFSGAYTQTLLDGDVDGSVVLITSLIQKRAIFIYTSRSSGNEVIWFQPAAAEGMPLTSGANYTTGMKQFDYISAAFVSDGTIYCYAASSLQGGRLSSCLDLTQTEIGTIFSDKVSSSFSDLIIIPHSSGSVCVVMNSLLVDVEMRCAMVQNSFTAFYQPFSISSYSPRFKLAGVPDGRFFGAVLSGNNIRFYPANSSNFVLMTSGASYSILSSTVDAFMLDDPSGFAVRLNSLFCWLFESNLIHF